MLVNGEETTWGYEALCDRCGELYMPHSLDKEDLEHYECGGTAKEAWAIRISESGMTRKQLKKRLRWRWDNIGVILTLIVLVGFLVVMIDRMP